LGCKTGVAVENKNFRSTGETEPILRYLLQLTDRNITGTIHNGLRFSQLLCLLTILCRSVLTEHQLPLFFNSRTVHLHTIKVFFIYQLMHTKIALKILKFTLKQLLHVSVQSPSSGSALLELAKVGSC